MLVVESFNQKTGVRTFILGLAFRNGLFFVFVFFSTLAWIQTRHLAFGTPAHAEIRIYWNDKRG